jgi:hypothetical protein
VGIKWQAIEALSDWQFVTYDPMPSTAKNVSLVSRSQWSYADMVASVDAMVCKVGYGVATDCIANSTPMVHLPRRDFAEYNAIIAGLDRWQGRVELTEKDFVAGLWGPALHKAMRATLNAQAFRTDGARIIADRLTELAGST